MSAKSNQTGSKSGGVRKLFRCHEYVRRTRPADHRLERPDTRNITGHPKCRGLSHTRTRNLMLTRGLTRRMCAPTYLTGKNARRNAGAWRLDGLSRAEHLAHASRLPPLLTVEPMACDRRAPVHFFSYSLDLAEWRMLRRDPPGGKGQRVHFFEVVSTGNVLRR